MKYSRAARITTLLVIDVVFFFVELIVGYAIGSLALVADSFHMLNDVVSLIVALYALKLAKNKATSQYSYGWHRAEILAALVNGVFLLALCFSIFLEAIERFFSTPEISNPKLVVIVGSLGLLSNFVGLFLFNEHGHSHGDEGHSHEDEHSHSHSHAHAGTHTPITDERTALLSASTQAVPRARSNSSSMSETIYGHPAATRAAVVYEAEEIARAKSPEPRGGVRDRRSSIPPPPAGRSNSLHIVAEEARRWSNTNGFTGDEEDGDEHETETVVAADSHDREHAHAHGNGNGKGKPHSHDHDHDHSHDHSLSNSHDPADLEAAAHDHAAYAKPTKEGSSAGGAHGGHSHGNMNMRALVLHVLGDALGNIGVIATGLIIWLMTFPGRFYCDPIISLVITVIIFSSAMPLVRSASFILLQAVPHDISLDDVRDAIIRVPGVLAIHELHVWQLSESKVVASVHVWVSKTKEYMGVAVNIRKAFHDHGIHSCTIQPEFHPNELPEPLMTTEDTNCLIACGAGEACDQNFCCPPVEPRS